MSLLEGDILGSVLAIVQRFIRVGGKSTNRVEVRRCCSSATAPLAHHSWPYASFSTVGSDRGLPTSGNEVGSTVGEPSNEPTLSGAERILRETGTPDGMLGERGETRFGGQDGIRKLLVRDLVIRSRAPGRVGGRNNGAVSSHSWGLREHDGGHVLRTGGDRRGADGRGRDSRVVKRRWVRRYVGSLDVDRSGPAH